MYIKKRLFNRPVVTLSSSKTDSLEEKNSMTENDSGIEVILEMDQSALENISVLSEQISLEDEEYSQIDDQPGLVAIFNFKKRIHNLMLGKDTELLRNCFESIGYAVREDHCNSTKIDFIGKLKAISTEDFSNRSCLIIIILSEGGLEGNFYTPDGDYTTSWEIMEMFISKRIHPSLKNKPKIFIIQSCKHLKKDFLSDAGRVFTPKMSSTFKLPRKRHILLAFGEIEQFDVVERTKNGTLFIREFCKNINTYGKREDICSLLIRTSRCIEHQNKKLIPTFLSTLTKKFYLCKNYEGLTINTDILTNHELTKKQFNDKEIENAQTDCIQKELKIKELKNELQEKNDKIMELESKIHKFQSDMVEFNETLRDNKNQIENTQTDSTECKIRTKVPSEFITKQEYKIDSTTQTCDRFEENQVDLSMSKLCLKSCTKLYDYRTTFIYTFIIFTIMISISLLLRYVNESEEEEINTYDWFNRQMQHYTDIVTNFLRNK